MYLIMFIIVEAGVYVLVLSLLYVRSYVNVGCENSFLYYSIPRSLENLIILMIFTK